MNKDDLILISVDDHIAEPADMFDAHVPAKYKDRAPRVVVEPDGIQQWYYGDIRGRNMGLNAVAGKPREMYNIDASRYDEMRPGCFNVDERVRDMNAGGQLAGLNFPNFTGFSGQVLNQGPDREVNLVMIKAYNDWHIDEWCAAYPGRFIPCGILPLFDVAEAAKEVNRLAAKGCHAVTFSENPEALQMPSIHTRYWYPLFEAVCENKTVLCTHVGSASRSPQVSTDAPPSVQMTASSMMSMFTFTELIWAQFWADFPELKFSLTEATSAGYRTSCGGPSTSTTAIRAGRWPPSRPATAAPPTCSNDTSTPASSATKSVCATWIGSTRTCCAGSPTSRTPTATGRSRRRTSSTPWATSTTR